MATRSDGDRWLTRNRAAMVVVVLLASAAVLGFVEQRTIPADDINLRALPARIGEWSVVEEEASTQPDGSYTLLRRVYQSADGRKAHVTVQATYTRLGSLRDWSLAAMASGWTTAEETVWQSECGLMRARVERMAHRGDRQIALTWYTSEKSQAPSLKKAEMLGARDRLLGGTKPWASLYIVAASGDEDADRMTVQELAGKLGPNLRQIVDA
ncbi:MAG: exosortase-associated EpsI family protein [Armatimonadota bacterium]